jgi:IS605 OrfB family transposase
MKITEVEIVPIHDGNNYNLILKYNKKIPKINVDDDENYVTDNDKMLSIDLGMVNITSMITSNLDTPNIIDGRYLLKINKVANDIMDKYKSEIKKKYNSDTSIHYRNLLYRKNCKIIDYMHKVSSAIINYAKENNIGTIIIGYNKKWKCNVKMGNNNRKFYEIPFRKFLNMLFYKGVNNGIFVKEIKESYTSICDGLGLEEIKPHEEYKGERTKRGLFQSCTGNNINADINGALNILRKYIYYYRPDLKKQLETRIKNKILINNLKTVKKIYFKEIRRSGVNEKSLNDELLRDYSKELSRKYKRNLLKNSAIKKSTIKKDTSKKNNSEKSTTKTAKKETKKKETKKKETKKKETKKKETN